MPLDNKDLRDINEHLAHVLPTQPCPQAATGAESRIVHVKDGELDFGDPSSYLWQVMTPPCRLIDASGKVWEGPRDGAIRRTNLKTGATVWLAMDRQGRPVVKGDEVLLEYRTLPAPLKIVDSRGMVFVPMEE
jgi:hypothetical protein